jgi:NTP pyrophosphatase (non-canonical NTP hydrolase)
MTLNEYQGEALRTAPRDAAAYPRWLHPLAWDLSIPAPHPRDEALKQVDQLVWTLGLTGEAGEVADYLKKVRGHGHPLDPEKMKKELGDVLWYLAVLADSFGFTLNEVAQANVDKLRARYPNGFTIADSKAQVGR